MKIDPHHQRSDVRAIVRAVAEGWLRSAGELEKALAILMREARENTDPRARVNAAKGVADCLVKIADLAQRVGEADDKAARLDAGEATERTTFVVEVPRVGRLTDGNADG